MNQIHSMADKDRLRARAAQTHKANAAIADVARTVVEQFLKDGRSTDACMADLVRAAREHS